MPKVNLNDNQIIILLKLVQQRGEFLQSLEGDGESRKAAIAELLEIKYELVRAMMPSGKPESKDS